MWVWLSEKEMSRRLNVKNFSHLICQNFTIFQNWRLKRNLWYVMVDWMIKTIFFHSLDSNKNFKKYIYRNIWLKIEYIENILQFVRSKIYFFPSLFADLKLLCEYIQLVNVQLAHGAEVTIRTLRNLSQLLKPALSLSHCRSWSESHRLDNYIIRCVSSLAWESTNRGSDSLANQVLVKLL